MIVCSLVILLERPLTAFQLLESFGGSLCSKECWSFLGGLLQDSHASLRNKPIWTLNTASSRRLSSQFSQTQNGREGQNPPNGQYFLGGDEVWPPHEAFNFSRLKLKLLRSEDSFGPSGLASERLVRGTWCFYLGRPEDLGDGRT